MNTVRLIEIHEEILGDNSHEAHKARELLDNNAVRMLNIMASPGAGKTSLILRTLNSLTRAIRPAVIEADIDSQVDADKIAETGVEAVQIRTGGFCHVDARMVMKTLTVLDLASLDLLFLENVGNLICPAQFDTGAHKSVMILSVPEGDDKPLKYPLMFHRCDALVVNKIDFLNMTDFDMEKLEQRVRSLNPGIKIFPLSAKTGEGFGPWIEWVDALIKPENQEML